VFSARYGLNLYIYFRLILVNSRRKSAITIRDTAQLCPKVHIERQRRKRKQSFRRTYKECSFYRVTEHSSCHGMSRQMLTFYAIKLLCSGKRQETHSAFGRPTHREENIDLFYDQVCQPADWIHLAKNKIQRRVFVKKTMTVLVLQLVR